MKKKQEWKIISQYNIANEYVNSFKHFFIHADNVMNPSKQVAAPAKIVIPYEIFMVSFIVESEYLQPYFRDAGALVMPSLDGVYINPFAKTDGVIYSFPRVKLEISFPSLWEATYQEYSDIDYEVRHADAISSAIITHFHLLYENHIKNMREMPYKDYLETHHWKVVRSMKLKEAGGRCQLCNDVNNLHVHHRTYENRGDENPGDLIVLCANCHAKFHDKLPVVK